MGPQAKNGAGRVKAGKSPSPPTSTSESDASRAASENQDPRFAALAGSLPLIVWTASPDGAVNYVNEALTYYSGRSAESLLGDQWLSIVHPDDRDKTARSWKACVATSDPWRLEFRILRADGAYRSHHVRARADLDDARHVVRWWGNAVDVHEYRLLEAQAAQRAADREAVLESVGDGIYTLDRAYRFTYLNGNAVALLGRARDSLVGKILWDEFPETRDSDLGSMLTRVLTTGQSERLLQWSGPQNMWFDVGANPTPDGITVALHDITEVKSLSEQLISAQRLEVLGQLTGGIAHDFNNLLTVVMGATESLAMETRLGPMGREMIELVTQATMRGAELTHRLLAFARRQPLAPQSVRITRHVGDLIPLLKRTLGEGIEVASNLTPGLRAAQVDPGQLEGALLNLAINARDAMPGGGTLELGTSLVEVDAEFAGSHDNITPGAYVVITVADNGMGISPENLKRMFDPFFTTKAISQGSGLGLAMVWGFAQQSGGHVSVYSELGHGTTVRLYLPVAPTEVDLNAESWVEPEPQVRGSGHVLVVEDDDLVRRFATERLIARGYSVTAVASGPEALRALDTIGRVDLLFTDIVLPGGMTGRQLATDFLALSPGMPVLYTSGYTESVLLHDGQLDPDAILLPKPYSSRQLTDAVQALLAPSPLPPSQ